MNLSEISKFQSISIDTRSLVPGDLFVAIKGPNFDGHAFILEAEAKGAIAAIVEDEVGCNMPLIKVSNTFHVFGELAAQRRQQITAPIVALTGSCGKTTTKEMLASTLSLTGTTLATEKNLNNNIGVPLTLLQLTPEYKFAVIEVGANQPGEIDYAAKLVKPNLAMITNVAPVHLEGFGSLDDVACIKGNILRHLTEDGVAILNADDQYLPYWCNLLDGKSYVTFGIEHQADVMAHDIKIHSDVSPQFVLQTPQGEIDIMLAVFGQHNVMNALAAATAAHVLGIPLAIIKQGLETMQPVAGRLVKKSGLNGCTILDDSYSANPRSMVAAIRVLVNNPGEKILVAADMGELGAESEHYHHELGITAKEMGVHKLYAIGELTKLTVEVFGEGGYHCSARDELIAKVRDTLRPDVIVLVKGSNVHRMWEIVEALLEV